MLKPILACVLLAGCSDAFMTTYSSPATPATVTVPTPVVDANLSVANQVDIGNTCAGVAAARGSSSAQSGLAVLRFQAGFTETELAYISTGTVASGMSEKAAICALGGNSAMIQEVKTISAPGHVSKIFTFSNAARLYTDNGVVTVYHP